MDKIQVNFSNLHLVEPCLEYMQSYRRAIGEYFRHKVTDFAYPIVGSRREIATFLKNSDHMRRGIGVPSGIVPYSSFWLVDGEHYLGSGDVRHYLNDKLRRLGGNIGYSIRPAVWRQGLGTVQFTLLLIKARELKVHRPIITCFDGNVASAKIIERQGGTLLRKIVNDFGGTNRLTRIYEIDLTQ